MQSKCWPWASEEFTASLNGSEKVYVQAVCNRVSISAVCRPELANGSDSLQVTKEREGELC